MTIRAHKLAHAVQMTSFASFFEITMKQNKSMKTLL